MILEIDRYWNKCASTLWGCEQVTILCLMLLCRWKGLREVIRERLKECVGLAFQGSRQEKEKSKMKWKWHLRGQYSVCVIHMNSINIFTHIWNDQYFREIFFTWPKYLVAHLCWWWWGWGPRVWLGRQWWPLHWIVPYMYPVESKNIPHPSLFFFLFFEELQTVVYIYMRVLFTGKILLRCFCNNNNKLQHYCNKKKECAWLLREWNAWQL